MWAIFTIVSAAFLGLYEVVKKIALDRHNVFSVLFFSTLFGFGLVAPFFLLSSNGTISAGSQFYVPAISAHTHLLIFIKAAIINISWVFSFIALKHLPITIVAPVRATTPIWTLLGALILFNEQLNGGQWIGLLITVCCFVLFSQAGKAEGIHFLKNKWVWFIIIGTLASSANNLYDKYLIHNINRFAVQVYFMFYQVVLMFVILLFMWKSADRTLRFTKGTFAILLIGLFLVVSDFFYFYAISCSGSLISVISTLRRGSVIVAFVVGAIIFKEKNIKKKSIYLAGILGGMLMLMYSS